MKFAFGVILTVIAFLMWLIILIASLLFLGLTILFSIISQVLTVPSRIFDIAAKGCLFIGKRLGNIIIKASKSMEDKK